MRPDGDGGLRCGEHRNVTGKVQVLGKSRVDLGPVA